MLFVGRKVKDQPLAYGVTATLLNSAGCWHLMTSDSCRQQLMTDWLKHWI